MQITKKRIILSGVLVAIVPLLIAFGVLLGSSKSYHAISILIAIVAIVPFFAVFEHKKPKARELVIISIMTCVSVMGRLAFSLVPGFKPVTAITIITGISMGAEAGFFTGAMSALVSNIFFGQGPWTPFQMLVWGLIGYFAGLLGRLLKKNRPLLYIYGILAGVAFSLIMDIWTVLALGDFSLARYITVMAAGLPFMVAYAVSNVIFLLVLARPIEKKLSRVRIKYGMEA